MNQENYLWGCKKIANELKKINIDIYYTTVNRNFSTFRKQGRIQPNVFWKKVLKDALEAERKSKQRIRQAVNNSSQNMNTFVERLNGTIRREALDHFLLFLERQIRKILRSYVDYYNHQRPHQEIKGILAGEIKKTLEISKNKSS